MLVLAPVHSHIPAPALHPLWHEGLNLDRLGSLGGALDGKLVAVHKAGLGLTQADSRRGLEPTERQADVAHAAQPLANGPLAGRKLLDGRARRQAVGQTRARGRGRVELQHGRLLQAGAVQRHRQDALPDDAGVLGADGEFLADVAALAEVDAAKEVDVALQREGHARHNLVAPLGHPVQHPPDGVVLCCRRFHGLRGSREDDAAAKATAPGINAADCCGGRQGVASATPRGTRCPLVRWAQQELGTQLVAPDVCLQVVERRGIGLDKERGVVRVADGATPGRDVVKRMDECVEEDTALRGQEDGVDARRRRWGDGGGGERMQELLGIRAVNVEEGAAREGGYCMGREGRE